MNAILENMVAGAIVPFDHSGLVPSGPVPAALPQSLTAAVHLPTWGDGPVIQKLAALATRLNKAELAVNAASDENKERARARVHMVKADVVRLLVQSGIDIVPANLAWFQERFLKPVRQASAGL